MRATALRRTTYAIALLMLTHPLVAQIVAPVEPDVAEQEQAAIESAEHPASGGQAEHGVDGESTLNDVDDVPADDRVTRIEALLTDAYPAGEPGAAVIVTDDGEVVYHGARGMANLELGVPLEPDMVFRLGSITKQFTAAAILLLEEQGKLAVRDAITEYLPDYPVHGHTITIEHLLTHTSGIFSYTSIPHYMLSEVRRDLTTDELIDKFKAEAMEFAPGVGWSYSNSGYVLLGAIIEKLTGQSYADFVQESIFEPLRMRNSHYGGHQLIPRRAAGYRREGDGYVNARYLSMTQPHAAGALLSNIGDLALWNAGLDGDQLLSEASRQKMFTAYRLADGESTDYGYGFRVGTLRGSPSIYHGGGIFGFTTFAIRLPEEGVYVAVLQNGSPVNPSRLCRQIAALAIGKPFPEWRQVEVAPEILERYAGTYRVDDVTWTLSVEDGRLYTERTGGRRVEALAHTATGFFYPETLSHFEIVAGDDESEVAYILVYNDGVDEPEKAIPVEPEEVE